ncbi:MAG: EAL domain-containing protein [Acidimicrobiales bacterium]
MCVRRVAGTLVVTLEDATGDLWQRDSKPLVLAGEPVLEYQPVVDLASGMLLGFEALLRWRHPTEGLILPQLLIPWAEANGDIVALGEWVLNEGCKDASAWPSSAQLAVNCSIVQLRRGVASSSVESALEASGFNPDRLTVEITEHTLSDEPALKDLRRIAAMGVQLAVDDVGTSWNSFDLLRKLAVNTVKIDESFVGSLEAQAGINRMVVETVVYLAHSSGMSTVAEGVETELHASIVNEFDCDAAQGYFFAPPLSVDQAEVLANAHDFRFPMKGGGWSEDGALAGIGIVGPLGLSGRELMFSDVSTVSRESATVDDTPALPVFDDSPSDATVPRVEDVETKKAPSKRGSSREGSGERASERTTRASKTSGAAKSTKSGGRSTPRTPPSGRHKPGKR